MGQRISIQYSIDIDDLEDEVVRLLDKSFGELDKLSKTTIKDPLSLSTIEDVDSLRRGLANVDAALQDVSAIVNGYVAYKVAPSDANEVEETENNHEEPSEIEYSF